MSLMLRKAARFLRTKCTVSFALFLSSHFGCENQTFPSMRRTERTTLVSWRVSWRDKCSMQSIAIMTARLSVVNLRCGSVLCSQMTKEDLHKLRRRIVVQKGLPKDAAAPRYLISRQRFSSNVTLRPCNRPDSLQHHLRIHPRGDVRSRLDTMRIWGQQRRTN